MSDNTIGRALRTRRAQLDLDQRDAASRIGMSRTTYSSYERDTQRPSVDVLPAIAEFLEVSIDDVLVLYGASAVAAARTALGRLSSRDNAAPEASSDDRITASEYDSGTERTSVNGNGNHSAAPTAPLPSAPPYSSVAPAATTFESPVKPRDDKEKNKKKKKKKGKREKLINPAFSTHV
ncbi:MAG: helix-turn-helix domain-containing protein [Acidimicrobiales bacterium]